jgi:predicted transcriptional regulator
LPQVDLAEALGVTQAHISKIEHGDISGIDLIRAYVTTLGGHVELVATVGDRCLPIDRGLRASRR